MQLEMRIEWEQEAESVMNKSKEAGENLVKSRGVCSRLRAGVCARQTDLDNHVSTSSG